MWAYDAAVMFISPGKRVAAAFLLGTCLGIHAGRAVTFEIADPIEFSRIIDTNAALPENEFVSTLRRFWETPYYLEQISRTTPRSQRCAGSASNRGCQSNDTVNSGVVTGRAKLCIPARKIPVWRSGTVAIKSEARASASAVEKPPTMVTSSRSSPNGFKASSIGPNSSPRREMQMCRPAA
jgi:hypothetical protein